MGNNSPRQTSCPECGAHWRKGLTCWEMLGSVLAWEGQDLALAAVHFLSVASYNLQHPARFTPEAITSLGKLFCDHIDNHTPIAYLRRQVVQAAEGNKKVLRREPAQPVLRRWPITIADVYLSNQPQNAADRVHEWANAIRTILDDPPGGFIIQATWRFNPPGDFEGTT